MRYIAKLIVDTPTYKKGTKFFIELNRIGDAYSVYEENEKCETYKLVEIVKATEFDTKNHWLSDGRFSELTVDEERYNQLVCPICGETRLRFWSNQPYKMYNKWHENFDKVVPVMFTCRNGHRNKLFDIIL